MELLGVKPVQRSCSPPPAPAAPRQGKGSAMGLLLSPQPGHSRAGPLKNLILPPTACKEASKAADDLDRHNL